MSRFRTFLAICFCSGYLASQGSAATPVAVVLRPNARVSEKVVKTSHIASVLGGEALTRQRIANLDITEHEDSEIGIVTRSQVELRLRLEGIPTDSLQITGPPVIMIRWDSSGRENGNSITARPRGDRPVLRMAQAALADVWHVAEDDIDVRLTRPTPIGIRELLDSDSSIVLKPFVPESAAPGTIRLPFGAYRDGTLIQRSVIMIEARLFRSVATATSDIAARKVLTSEDVRMERRAVGGRVARLAATEVFGKVTTHAIQKGAVVLTSDLREIVSSTSRPGPLIKRGDRVRLVARGNGLTVSVRSCESLENGHAGETIRVRNLSSKKIVTGRVVKSGEVEIALWR